MDFSSPFQRHRQKGVTLTIEQETVTDPVSNLKVTAGHMEADPATDFFGMAAK